MSSSLQILVILIICAVKTHVQCTLVKSASGERCREASIRLQLGGITKTVPRVNSKAYRYNSFIIPQNLRSFTWQCGTKSYTIRWQGKATLLRVTYNTYPSRGGIRFILYNSRSASPPRGCRIDKRAHVTYDWCRSGEYIKLESGRKVPKGTVDSINPVSPHKREMTWHCEETKERVAWYGRSNCVRVSFVNGRIKWEFFNCINL